MKVSEALLTVVEVAARLKCHPHTVRRWIWDRKMRAVKVGDLVRVPEQELAKFIRPASEKPARRESRQPRKGAKALVATMRKLRTKIDPTDVELMERMIAEAEQLADWSSPLG
ncbi:MAG: helix-turn-helix domain-containing protein [Acidobacteriota bacterium]